MKEALLTLDAEMRKETGTGAARALRKRGMLPATVYGKGKETLSIAVQEKEITKCYRRPQYISQVFELNIDQKKYKVLPKAIQLHPITDIVNHIDFVFLDTEVQKICLPVVYVNKETCLGVKRGGYFNIVKRNIKIACPIANLQRKIEIDVAPMKIADVIKAKELVLPTGATLLENPELVIASVIGKRGKGEDEEAANTNNNDKDKK